MSEKLLRISQAFAHLSQRVGLHLDAKLAAEDIATRLLDSLDIPSETVQSGSRGNKPETSAIA
jgi:hypothetical protein